MEVSEMAFEWYPIDGNKECIMYNPLSKTIKMDFAQISFPIFRHSLLP